MGHFGFFKLRIMLKLANSRLNFPNFALNFWNLFLLEFFLFLWNTIDIFYQTKIYSFHRFLEILSW